VGSPDRVAFDMGWIGEAKQKNCVWEKNLIEGPTPLQLSKLSANLTNAANTSKVYAEMDFVGLNSNNLVSNCLVKEKDQIGLLLNFQKIDETRKSDRVAGFMEEMDKANSS
jgi:hypothetical protein